MQIGFREKVDKLTFSAGLNNPGVIYLLKAEGITQHQFAILKFESGGDARFARDTA